MELIAVDQRAIDIKEERPNTHSSAFRGQLPLQWKDRQQSVFPFNSYPDPRAELDSRLEQTLRGTAARLAHVAGEYLFSAYTYPREVEFKAPLPGTASAAQELPGPAPIGLTLLLAASVPSLLHRVVYAPGPLPESRCVCFVHDDSAGGCRCLSAYRVLRNPLSRNPSVSSEAGPRPYQPNSFAGACSA